MLVNNFKRLLHPMAEHLGTVTDMEQFKQRINEK